MLPVLQLCAGKLWLMRELVARVADDLGLTEEERERQVPSGGMTAIGSRVHWAKTYLKQAGLLEQPRRGAVQISPRGRELLSTQPGRIDTAVLQQYDKFRSFQELTRLMVRFNVGVRVARAVEIKRVNLDYFEDVDFE